MNGNYKMSSGEVRTLSREELCLVSGGHPAVVAGAAMYGGYQFGKAVCKGAKKAYSWAREKLSKD